MTKAISRIGLTSAILAFFAALCCVLPMALILLGLGGGWVAVFGKFAAASTYLIIASVVLIAVAWVVAWRQKAPAKTLIVLGVGTLLALVAIGVYYAEGSINNYFITLM